jgi:hypothetical protein
MPEGNQKMDATGDAKHQDYLVPGRPIDAGSLDCAVEKNRAQADES